MGWKDSIVFSTHWKIYVGLLDKVVSWANKWDYQVEFEDNKFYGTPFEENEMISYEGVKDYMTRISKYKPRDYQIEAVYDALKYNRKLLISPTASGKSLMIYSVVRYFAERNKDPPSGPHNVLVEQMYKDFEDYGWNSRTGATASTVDVRRRMSSLLLSLLGSLSTNYLESSLMVLT